MLGRQLPTRLAYTGRRPTRLFPKNGQFSDHSLYHGRASPLSVLVTRISIHDLTNTPRYRTDNYQKNERDERRDPWGQEHSESNVNHLADDRRR